MTITASRLYDLAEAAAQLVGGDADLVSVLVDGLEARQEAEAAQALVAGLQALVEEQRAELERSAERIRDLERRDLAAIVCAFHAGVLTQPEARALAAPRLPNLELGLGPMRRVRRRHAGRPLLQLVRGVVMAIAAVVLAP